MYFFKTPKLLLFIFKFFKVISRENEIDHCFDLNVLELKSIFGIRLHMCIDIIMKGKNNQTVIKLSVRIHEKFFLVKYLKSITHTAVNW